MTEYRSPLYRNFVRTGIALVWLLLAGCIHEIDIQQGNLLDQEAVEQVEVGMSRSAVRFLLGTPTVDDPFRSDRWDYPYYYKPGRAKEYQAERRWIVVYFDDADLVSRIERNAELTPGS